MLRFSAYFKRRLGTHPRVSHAEIISLFYGTPWMTWDLIHNNGGACCIGGLELLCQHLDRSSCIIFQTFYSYTLINLRKSSFFIPFSSHDAFWLVLAMYHKFSPILFLSTWQYRKINLYLVDQFTASSIVYLKMLTGGELSYFLLVINHTFLIISLFRLILKSSYQFEKFYSISIAHDSLTNAFLHTFLFLHPLYS